uniref:Uncharacterized protein n=1 Tax=Daphnia galeata TaxID=27404 RepID=A0A8J2RS39_9CRUS|nr:unnamed protein product [Daphnia galeata]
MIIFYRPFHILVLTVTVPLSIYYFVLMISDMHGRLKRQMDTISPQELELFERSIKLEERRPAESDTIVAVPTTISWDDLVDEAMLKPILDLDGPKKWPKLQTSNVRSSERKLEKRSIHDRETTSVQSKNATIRFDTMDENLKSNLHLISYNCTVEYVNKNRLQQDHPCVIDVIQRFYLHELSLLSNISSKTDHSNVKCGSFTLASDKQSNIQTDSILRILHNQQRPNGFFIDCCDNDDKEFLFSTSYIEKTLQWQGLFIKANQQSHLLSHNRQVFALPICLSPESFPVKMTFDAANKSEVFTTQCFPLYSVLLAVNRTKLDWFRLSARGFELRILKTVPWNKVNVTLKISYIRKSRILHLQILSVEWNHVPAGDEAAAINRYMKKCGFTKYRQISRVNHIHNKKVNNYINTHFLKNIPFQSL